jgi:3-phenylpropionate/trans-cinnamate dioxygenase ferredoxin reductase subunit
MTTSPTFAIVGGGLAGAKVAEALRDTELPDFFTDQYDLGMVYVGHAPDYEKVVLRGDVEKREFTAFWVDRDDRLLAGMNVNIWEGLDDIEVLIRSRKPLGSA